MTKLETLSLWGNQIGDAGVTALAGACASGALPKLTSLSLGGNKIGDAGCTALAEACARGALANLRTVNLGGNPGSSEPVEKVLRELRGE